MSLGRVFHAAADNFEAPVSVRRVNPKLVWVVLGDWQHSMHVIESIRQARLWNPESEFYLLLSRELIAELPDELRQFEVSVVNTLAYETDPLLQAFRENFFVSGQMGGHANRDDFNQITSARLFYVHAWMSACRVEHVIHIENDNLIYFKAVDWMQNISVCRVSMATTCREMNTRRRFMIAGVVYVRDHMALGHVLTHSIQLLQKGRKNLSNRLGTEYVNDMSLLADYYWSNFKSDGLGKQIASGSLTILPEDREGLGIVDPHRHDPKPKCMWENTHMVFDNSALAFWYFGDFFDKRKFTNNHGWGAYERMPANRSTKALEWNRESGISFPVWDGKRVASLHMHSKQLSEAASTEVSQDRIRRTSYPYITGDAFRSLCSKKCESGGRQEASCNFKAGDVRNGDCIFIATTNLATSQTTLAYLHAFDKIRPAITASYLLVTHNGDVSLPDGDSWHPNESHPEDWNSNFSHWLRDKNLMYWFASNCHWYEKKNAKVRCIPLGLENDYIPNARRLAKTNISRKREHASIPQQATVLLAFERDDAWKPDRGDALDALSGRAFTINNRVQSFEAWAELAKSSDYVVCPQGHGLDTHRLWETLLLGSIPIVKSSTLDEMFETLPVLIVKEWTDINEKLLTISKKVLRQRRLDAAYWPFWRDQILDAKRSMRLRVQARTSNREASDCP